jgi:hypothetical protein
VQIGEPSPTATPTNSLRDFDIDAATVGSCVQWDSLQGDQPTTLVACAKPHRDEITKVLDLKRIREWPGVEGLDRIGAQDCPSALLSYLAAPSGRPGITWAYIIPEEDAWRYGGSRTMVCTAVVPGRKIFSGSVRGAGGQSSPVPSPALITS